jgi:hypothetical protein
MALQRSSLPINAATRAAPFDALLSFTPPGGETFTASGWLTGAAANVVTLGPSISPTQQQSPTTTPGAAGRSQGLWMLSVSAASFAGGNESYQFFLYGSNDPTFTAGNCDLLGVYDLAATSALRLGFPAGQSSASTAFPTIGPASAGGFSGGAMSDGSATRSDPRISQSRSVMTATAHIAVFECVL